MLDINSFDVWEHYAIFEGSRASKMHRTDFICGLLKFERETGCRVSFVDVNGYPIRRTTADGREDLVVYNRKVVETAQSFILLPKSLEV